ncbi:hypothetical protein NDU88_000188 [Pleurodeles waltl]|uniref:Uncharacterized protein n=1 Tax=Pleurodeles waltl TaxID=8319 RepID=A0AAV7N7C0_PLEWA|nr:hypothetical protein NDU88_000188 [Pleurodeles waltl]
MLDCCCRHLSGGVSTAVGAPSNFSKALAIYPVSFILSVSVVSLFDAVGAVGIYRKFLWLCRDLSLVTPSVGPSAARALKDSEHPHFLIPLPALVYL